MNRTRAEIDEVSGNNSCFPSPASDAHDHSVTREEEGDVLCGTIRKASSSVLGTATIL
jgi:hypothetical protein